MDCYFAKPELLALGPSQSYGAAFGNEGGKRDWLRSYSFGYSSIAPSLNTTSVPYRSGFSSFMPFLKSTNYATFCGSSPSVEPPLKSTNVNYRSGLSSFEPLLKSTNENYCRDLTSLIPSLKTANENCDDEPAANKRSSLDGVQQHEDTSQNRKSKVGKFPKIVCAGSRAKAKPCVKFKPSKTRWRMKGIGLDRQVEARKVYVENQKLQMEGIRLRWVGCLSEMTLAFSTLCV